MLNEVPFLGAGLGFRRELKDEILSAADRIDFLELIVDQYIDKPLVREQEAADLSRKFPVVLHGVDLSIGTDCPIDEVYLEGFRRVAEMVKPKWVSDHLCFTRVPGNSLGQLTPLCFNENVVDIVVKHIKQAAGAFDCPFLIENISYYFVVPPSTMTEAEFITRIIRESGCWLLLDVTNLRNNAINHKYDPYEFLDRIPLDRVVQIHLAGSTRLKGLVIDSHSQPVHSEVFDLLRYAAPRMPALKGVLIERDQNFPPAEELFDELDKVREVLAESWVPHHLPGAPARLPHGRATAAHTGESV
jgi:uncharacterized protein